MFFAESNQSDFEAKGMESLVSKDKKRRMPSWEVPIEVVEDPEELKKWAEKSFAIALAKKKK